MSFGNFICMIVNGIMLSIMIVGVVVIIVSVFTMDLGTMFFGIVLIMGPAIVLSISMKIKEGLNTPKLNNGG